MDKAYMMSRGATAAKRALPRGLQAPHSAQVHTRQENVSNAVAMSLVARRRLVSGKRIAIKQGMDSP